MNRKSQDAAVGALVHMLKKAPPLRQDISSSISFSEASRPEMWSNIIQEQNQISEAVTVEHATSSMIASSRVVASKTTADALEELRGYKEMKNLLLSEGAKSYTSPNFASGAEHSSKGLINGKMMVMGMTPARRLNRSSHISLSLLITVLRVLLLVGVNRTEFQFFDALYNLQMIS
ncbi:hypothetical protein REPUB_Repub06bG0147000 [Reevesia pubescens]